MTDPVRADQPCRSLCAGRVLSLLCDWRTLPIAILLLLTAGGWFAWQTARSTDRALRTSLLQQTQLAALGVEPAELATLSGTLADEASPVYRKLKEQLARVRTANPNCRFLYLMGRRADQSVFFFVDSEPAGSEDESLPGDTYNEVSDLIHQVFTSGEAAVEGPIYDRWGTWVSGLVPVGNAPGEHATVVLGMDIAADDWNDNVFGHSAIPVGLALLLMVAVGSSLAALRHIAYRRLVEEKLRESREDLAVTLRSIGDGVIVTDRAGNITGMNIVAETLSGWSFAEAEGRPLAEVFQIINEDTRATAENPVEKALREGRVVGLANHTLLIARDGTEHPIADSAAPIQLEPTDELRGVVLVFRDVSDERDVELAIRRQRDFLQTLIDCIPAPVFYKNRDGVYLGCNQAFCAFLGLEKEDIIEKTVNDIAPSELARHYSEADEALIANPGMQEYEGPVTAADGETRIVAFRKATYGASTLGVDGLIGVMLDITERVKSEDRLSRLNECLLAFGPDSKANIDRITALGGELLGGTCALYNRLSEGVLCTVSDWKAPSDLQREDAPEGHICHDVIHREENAPFIASDLVNSPYAQTDPNVLKYGLNTYFGHVVRVRGRSTGSLCILYSSQTSINNDDKKLIGILASAIGMEEERLAAEVQITKTIEIQTALNMILRSSLGEVTLESVLESALRAIFQASWLAALPKGAIFVTDRSRPRVLLLRAQLDLPKPLHTLCAEVPFGHCLCGQAAERREIVYARCVDERHAVSYPGMRPHGHYVVPILNQDEVLGVIDLYLEEGHGDDKQEIAFLESVANTLAGVIMRKQAEESLVRSNDALIDLNRRLRENQRQLVQSEKMASIGQLAAGVAHEINNPVGFIKSNLGTLVEYIALFKTLLKGEEELLKALEAGDAERIDMAVTILRELHAHEDLGFVLGDVDQLLAESREGTDRVRDIVLNLKSFARLDEAEVKEADINEGIEATLKIVWNELKYKAEVVKNLQPLPRIRCYPGQLNQVFMNLLVNAAQAIPERGELRIETEADETCIRIRVSDTGTGITPDALPRLFDPFFTTKEPGKGTGLGLSISHGIIEKHGGRIDVESKPGLTTFTVSLPLVGVADE